MIIWHMMIQVLFLETVNCWCGEDMSPKEHFLNWLRQQVLVSLTRAKLSMSCLWMRVKATLKKETTIWHPSPTTTTERWSGAVKRIVKRGSVSFEQGKEDCSQGEVVPSVQPLLPHVDCSEVLNATTVFRLWLFTRCLKSCENLAASIPQGIGI